MSERRSIHRPDGLRVEQRADGKPVIAGYAAVFYNAADPGTRFMLWDHCEERILPGAFDKALKDDDVRALFNHSADVVLGRSTARTLRLSVDARGLRYEIDPPDTQQARDLMESIKRGDISGSSFAFDTRGEQYRRENGNYIRELTDLKLYDVGPVSFPAYTGTEAGIRAEGEPEPAVRSRVESLRAADRDRDLVDVTLVMLDLDD